MKNFLVCLLMLCCVSVCFAKDNQININVYFDLESDLKASTGGQDSNSKLKLGLSFGGNYLLNL
eukprot:COSAG01_NODE_10987_length_2032_cov_1.685463_1_plen_63_part_10